VPWQEEEKGGALLRSDQYILALYWGWFLVPGRTKSRSRKKGGSFLCSPSHVGLPTGRWGGEGLKKKENQRSKKRELNEPAIKKEEKNDQEDTASHGFFTP